MKTPTVGSTQRTLDYCIVTGTDAAGEKIDERIEVEAATAYDLAHLVKDRPHPITMSAVCYDTADVPGPPGESTCGPPGAPEFWQVCRSKGLEADGVTTIWECWRINGG